jgi:hypothetical protein
VAIVIAVRTHGHIRQADPPACGRDSRRAEKANVHKTSSAFEYLVKLMLSSASTILNWSCVRARVGLSEAGLACMPTANCGIVSQAEIC